ncbi:MAG TPA: OmpA family protein [Verrucomicrobiae bacterium]|jgi:peptidoglycan-associated lipoprotein
MKQILKLVAVMALLALGAAGCKNPYRMTNIPPNKFGHTGMETPTPLIEATNTAPAVPPTPPVNPPPPPIAEIVPPTPPPKTSDLDPNVGIKTSDLPLNQWKVAPEQPFVSETVFFDFDKSNVRPSEMPKLQRVASGMKGLKNRGLRIEGHCDERGTEEYNRALGERRALAIREHLARLGVDPNLIDTISYGEDRPAVQGHNEAAWSKNRRGEFIVIMP